MNNRLTVLAADIQAAHEDICQSNKYSAGRAVEAGRLLAEAKADENIPRGGWERWVETVAHVPYSTAQHYISLFRAIEKQSLTLEDITEAGQIGALSEAQRALHPRLAAAGFPVAVVRSVPEALDAVAAAGVPLRGRVAA